MSRHFGILPDEYRRLLESMTLPKIAAEAARFRADGKRCGTATALIIRWVFTHRIAVGDKSASNWFHKLYREAWAREKAARCREQSARPTARPVMGGRRRRERAGRLSFAHV